MRRLLAQKDREARMALVRAGRRCEITFWRSGDLVRCTRPAAATFKDESGVAAVCHTCRLALGLLTKDEATRSKAEDLAKQPPLFADSGHAPTEGGRR